MIRGFITVVTACLTALSGCSMAIPFVGQPDLDPRFQRLFLGDAPRIETAIPSSGVNSLFILLQTRDDISTWVGPFGEAIVMDDGILRGTRGMGEGLVATNVADAKILILSGRTGQTERFHTYMVGGTQNVVRSFVCDISVRGTEMLTIKADMIMTTVVEEDCTGPLGSFVNRYWIAQGRIVQSIQWTGPKLGSVSFRHVGI